MEDQARQEGRLRRGELVQHLQPGRFGERREAPRVAAAGELGEDRQPLGDGGQQAVAVGEIGRRGVGRDHGGDAPGRGKQRAQ